MANKIISYSKQSGEPQVPITTRIEWLPDGTIKPIRYWTPDGTLFDVVSQSTGIPIAFLKDRGVGIRFKTRAEITDTPEPHSELLHTRHETYLYLADKRFSEKNIIDGRYSHAGKEYISVTLDVFPDGEYELISFWARGERYLVDTTLEVENRGSFQAGGAGIRHKINASRVIADDGNDPGPQASVTRTAALYWELNKWFVCIAKST